MVRALLEAERAALDWHRWRIPGQRRHGQLRIGRNAAEILDFAREFADSQIAALDTALERCESARNSEIHDLLLRIQEGEQAHADWIAAQMDEIARHGAHEFRG